MNVVITGVGVVSPLGIGKDIWWDHILNGAGNFELHTLEQQEVVLGRVKETDFSSYISPWVSRKMDRMCLLSTVAAKIALNDAQLTVTDDNKHRIGGIFSTYHGSFETNKNEITSIVTKGLNCVSPFWFPMTTFNAPIGAISRTFGLQGVSTALVGSDAVFYAHLLLIEGKADAIIVVFGDQVDELYVKAFMDFGFLRKSHNGGIDASIYQDDQGFIFSEGWGAIVLEREDVAQQRGADIYGKLCDIEVTIDIQTKPSFNQYREISGDALEYVIRKIVSRNQLDENGFMYGIANGTAIDATELNVFKRVFDKPNYPILTGIKNCIGESFAPSTVFNIIAGALTLKNNMLPSNVAEDHGLKKVSHNGVSREFDYGIIGAYLPNGLVSAYLLKK
jgi:3-oxoacyl-[acyl-carrier-protein] synthase II